MFLFNFAHFWSNFNFAKFGLLLKELVVLIRNMEMIQSMTPIWWGFAHARRIKKALPYHFFDYKICIAKLMSKTKSIVIMPLTDVHKTVTGKLGKID